MLLFAIDSVVAAAPPVVVAAAAADDDATVALAIADVSLLLLPMMM